MICQARITTDSFAFATFYNVAECGAPSKHRIPVDDGDAELQICHECFKRFMTKKRADSTWYGWFDDEVPPTAPVRGSKAFNEAVTKAYREAHPTTPDGFISPGILHKWLLEQKQKEKQENPSPEAQIATIQAWLDGPGKQAKLKEQLPMHREIYALRLKLQMMSL